MRIYIAGPMHGYPESNFPAFDREKRHLEALGYEVVSPADVARRIKAQNPQADIRDFLREDCRELSYCDAIYMLEGWEHSYGAAVEHAMAKRMGLSFMYEWGRLNFHRQKG